MSETAFKKNKRKQRKKFYKEKSKARISLEQKQKSVLEGSWEVSFVLVKTGSPETMCDLSKISRQCQSEDWNPHLLTPRPSLLKTVKKPMAKKRFNRGLL